VKRSLPIGVAFTKKLFIDRFQGSESAATSALTQLTQWVARANLVYGAQLNFELQIGHVLFSTGGEAWDNHATVKDECTWL